MKNIAKIVSSFLNVDFPENILAEYSQDELHRIKIVNYTNCIFKSTFSAFKYTIGIMNFLKKRI
jgi:hypothetical protein